MKIYVVHDNPAFENRIKYVFDFIARHPLAEGKVSFAFKSGDGFKTLFFTKEQLDVANHDFFIPAQSLFFSKAIVPIPAFANTYKHDNYCLYSVESIVNKSVQSFFSNQRFGFDIVETIFFHISRLEEHFCPSSQIDIHGRMSSDEQFLVRHNISKTPVVDHLVFCFLQIIGIEPDKSPTRNRISFDIDVWKRFSGKPPIRSTMKYGLFRPNINAFLQVWKSYFKTTFGISKDPYNVFDWMLRPNDQVEQVIYFLMGGRSKFDKPVPVINEGFREVVLLAKQRGLKIGVHPSYQSWDSLEVFRREKEILEKVLGDEITKSRQHFLHFSFKTTPDILEAAAIKEDSTMGYPDRIGFRCGTGFPYYMYNYSEERPYKFKEMPMVVMDVSLMREAGNNDRLVIKILSDFMEANKYLTFITFNFHNSRFFDSALDGVDLEALFNNFQSTYPIVLNFEG